MRILPTCLVLAGLVLCLAAHAASSKEKVMEEQTLASLELRAEQAPARSQCLVYSQLIHEMVEYSAQQYAAGNVERASGMLKRAQELIRKIRARRTGGTKRLKESEILLRRAAYRLADMLHGDSYDDRPLVEQTLVQLNLTENDLLMEVFRK